MKHVHSFTGENRLIFLDNVRFLMIFFVVVLHCAASYGINEWWYVYDPKECRLIFSYVMFFVDTFAMPMLFIAGYFALPKIEQKGTFGFIKSKFVRLGIPWLICIVFIAPIIDFINHHTHGYNYSSLNYGQFWLEWLKRAIDFQFGFLTATEQFNQFVYWFISLLLFFFIVFALICALKKKDCSAGSFLPGKVSLGKNDVVGDGFCRAFIGHCQPDHHNHPLSLSLPLGSCRQCSPVPTLAVACICDFFCFRRLGLWSRLVCPDKFPGTAVFLAVFVCCF